MIKWDGSELSKYQAGISVVTKNGNREISKGRKPPKRVAIVGFGQPDCYDAPFDVPGWEIWGINYGNRLNIMKDKEGRFRADRWFDLHQLLAQSFDDMAWIKTCPVPLYLTEEFNGNPNALVYPLWEVKEKFDKYGPLYFASSFAYMVGLAMMEGFERIEFFGCSLDWGRERVVENGNLQFWIGLARGLGIEVKMNYEGDVTKHPALYGFEYWDERNAVADRCSKLIFELLSNRDIWERYVNLKAWMKMIPKRCLQIKEDFKQMGGFFV